MGIDKLLTEKEIIALADIVPRWNRTYSYTKLYRRFDGLYECGYLEIINFQGEVDKFSIFVGKTDRREGWGSKHPIYYSLECRDGKTSIGKYYHERDYYSEAKKAPIVVCFDDVVGKVKLMEEEQARKQEMEQDQLVKDGVIAARKLIAP